MHNELAPPVNLPEPGFYYHYKHDPEMRRADYPDAGIRNYAYEVLPSLGHYTEDDGPDDKYRIEYLPLYPWAPVYVASLKIGRVVHDHRPLSMFLELVPKGPDNEMIPRFAKITDPDVISLLTLIRDKQYRDLAGI